MANTQSIRFQFETLRSLAYSSVSSTYAGVGTALLHPARGYIVENLTDQTMIFSFDGVNPHFVLPTNGLYIQDITTNRYNDGQGFFLAQGDRLYVRQETSSPESGTVYFSVIYGAE